jgi:hypothetical protein
LARSEITETAPTKKKLWKVNNPKNAAKNHLTGEQSACNGSVHILKKTVICQFVLIDLKLLKLVSLALSRLAAGIIIK